MTRDTSSTASSSIIRPARLCAAEPATTAPRAPAGGPYTLGKSGVVTDTGLGVVPVPVPATEVSGESGRDKPDVRGVSLMRVSE